MTSNFPYFLFSVIPTQGTSGHLGMLATPCFLAHLQGSCAHTHNPSNLLLGWFCVFCFLISGPLVDSLALL